MKRIERAELAPAANLFAKACKASRLHNRLAGLALNRYGDSGPQISGVVRDHFPEHIKNHLRAIASAVTHYSDSAYAAKPKRVRFTTMRELSRDIATRDGGGFYGPRPR